MIWRAAALVTFVAIARASDPDPAELHHKSWLAMEENGKKTNQYAYREYQEQLGLDKNGKQNSRETTTWDIIGLQGSIYRKLVRRNDQPLAPKEQKREDDRLQKEAERRKKETPDQRKQRLFSYQYNTPYSHLPELCNLRYLREDQLDGVKVWVIEANPKPDLHLPDDNDKETANYRFVAWISQDGYYPARLDEEVVGDYSRLKKGTTITFEWTKLPDATWVGKQVKMDGQLKVVKMFKFNFHSITTYSDYHKFTVESKIVSMEGK